MLATPTLVVLLALLVSLAAVAAGYTIPGVDPTASCPLGHLLCDGGRCVKPSFQCDGDRDCVDGADEKGCPERCRPGHFRCDTTRCIVEAFLCDGDPDCNDGADERGCSGCNDGAFHCDGSRCIDSDLRCNGHVDCADGTDELTCSECPDDRFQCDGKRCLLSDERCDGVPQCRDGSDEVNCTECSEGARMCSGHGELDGDTNSTEPRPRPRPRCVIASTPCDAIRDPGAGSGPDPYQDCGQGSNVDQDLSACAELERRRRSTHEPSLVLRPKEQHQQLD